MLTGWTTRIEMAPTMPSLISEEIAKLERCDLRDVKTRWEEAFGRPPPKRISRSLLVRALAHRVQEKELGGLKPAVRRRLAKAVAELSAVQSPPVPSSTIKPGTRLLRGWHGVMHEVIVHEDGIQYRGKSWRSLSAVAREITGTRWSGPKFFGLRSPARPGIVRPMTANKAKRLRCAIYTRKSHEDGLEQDFNSLDAQREACGSYINSQAGVGWMPIRSRYDDGAFSGGTMDRPALQKLLADIRDRKIDTVVVYKVDRLTRSLADFAKIVDVFDAHSVSFVSVTQQFNTTTSMGRLTLNMLLSFAQFEREVTGERIRDKIAASKQKGMWMGGYVPLGYEPNGRSLTINRAEAETVRTIFRLYLEHGNVRRLKEQTDCLGLRTKVRKGVDGRMQGGRPLSRGYIYKLLGNPLYAGRIAHKGKTYDGLHDAIINDETWDAVQAKLTANARERQSDNRASDPSPLMGKLFDETGAPLTPSHAVKSGRRYRYYVSKRLISGSSDNADEKVRWRLPAGEIERFVGDAVTKLFADRAALADALRGQGIEVERIPHLLKAIARWRGPVLDLVERVDLGTDRIAIGLDLSSLAVEQEITIRHHVTMRIKRRGIEMRLVLEGNGAVPQIPDTALIQSVARAHKWFDNLSSGRSRSIGEIAKSEGLSDRYVSRLIPLAFLAPDIVEAILIGQQPVDLTAETLTRHTDLPLVWAHQKALLGIG